MTRTIHRWPGLIALALVALLAVSGAALSLFPAAERLAVLPAEPGLTVAALAERVQAAYPAVEQIHRAPSGKITAYWFADGQAGAAIIDPATGTGLAPGDPNQLLRWLTNLHRSLFLGDAGRMVMAAGAGAMLLLCLSGALLVARRTGGWRTWFSPLRGPLAGRLHVELARLALPGLLLSALTALWMSAGTFDLLPDGSQAPLLAPAETSGHMGLALADIPTLAQTPLSALRDLAFPYPGDARDVFTLKTNQGSAYLDQGTGAVLGQSKLSTWAQISETIYRLHTGQGAAALGLVLGLMALSVPILGGTGLLVWLSGQAGRPRVRNNQAAGRADTIILVGSEGGSTWGFAATLHQALSAQGRSVHTAAMAHFSPQRYRKAQRILILAATYGDGAAPASAKGFLQRLEALERTPQASLAVLGFGDRSFPGYCAFAKAVSAAADAKGWAQLLPLATVDRQSAQDFQRWGRALSLALGEDCREALELNHQPTQQPSQSLTLIARQDFGEEVQAPAAILRFQAPRVSVWQRLLGRGFARYQAGDLIGIIPEGSPVPRLYSLASSARDGFIEIAVRKQPGGLCSGLLTSLEPGQSVTAFLRRNPSFHAGRSKAPLILIGAGTGIAPLAGMVRANTPSRPRHVFCGMRHPDSDFLYGNELKAWQADSRLTRLRTAFSRSHGARYVQDALREDAQLMAQLIRDGARIMVCGGRDMASGVADTLAEILAPAGLTPATLKAEGRYVEDVY